MSKRVLILGSKGRFGRNAQAAFSWANWAVTSFDRRSDQLPDAAWGADVIVNAWNPAYPAWAKTLPHLTEAVIETAQNTGATVLIPGNVYPYGAGLPAVLSELTPHRATNPLGRLRAEMEASYRAADVRTILLRAGDFIDTQASGNWYDKIITAKLAKGQMVYPGALDVPHSWAFLPDLADVAVALAERRDELETYCDVNFPGYSLTAYQLQAALEAATDRNLKLSEMSWWPLQVARPFWPMARCLLEMRYLWNAPHEMTSHKLAELVPGYQPTPLIDALRASLPEQVHTDGRVAGRGITGFSGRPMNFCARHKETA